MPYRVLRCAHASGAEVYVLGNPGTRPLHLSRHCRRFFLSDCTINGDRDYALALEINCLVVELGITTVIAGDAPSTRALIAVRDLIEAPCFPLPNLAQFDELDDKWAFARLCEKLGILHPATRLLPDAAALRREIAAGAVSFPLVAKPLSRGGNSGVMILDGVETEKRMKAINYRPVLVQVFIPGEDIGASVFARAGNIEAIAVHRFWHQVYSTFRHDQVNTDLAKVVAHFKLDGVYNYDMRLGADWAVYYLECNPRFFFKIALSMLAGINFVERGLPRSCREEKGLIVADTGVRLPKALAFSLLTRGRCSMRDWAMFHYIFSDPLPYLMELLHLTV